MVATLNVYHIHHSSNIALSLWSQLASTAAMLDKRFPLRWMSEV